MLCIFECLVGVLFGGWEWCVCGVVDQQYVVVVLCVDWVQIVYVDFCEYVCWCCMYYVCDGCWLWCEVLFQYFVWIVFCCIVFVGFWLCCCLVYVMLVQCDDVEVFVCVLVIEY